MTIGDGSSAGGGVVQAGSGGAGGAGLPDTGSDAPVYLAPLGVLLVVIGGVALVAVRRRRETI